MFGGVLLIAILVAVQIRQTDIVDNRINLTSPETVAALQEKLDQLTNDIKLATALRETLPATTFDKNNNPPTQDYNQLANTKINSTAKKTELVNALQKQKNENSQLENQVKIIVTEIKTKENKTNNIKQQIQDQLSKNNSQKQSNKLIQDDINDLTNQITQKENTAKQPSLTARQETIYLPKLHASKTNQSAYLIIRFNRVYDASVRDDFNAPIDNQLGIPKTNRGTPIDSSEKSKNEIKKILQKYNNKNAHISIIVYGDSADQFYIVRDVVMDAGFEYDLKPSRDDSAWNFKEGGDVQQVMGK
jgi:chromosome segregation ATPase